MRFLSLVYAIIEFSGAVTAAPWITDTVRNRYCQVRSGNRFSTCSMGVCLTLTRAPHPAPLTCSDLEIAKMAALHGRIREELASLAGGSLIDDHHFPFSQQFALTSYSSFLRFENDPVASPQPRGQLLHRAGPLRRGPGRMIRETPSDGIEGKFSDPAKAYSLLIRMYLIVPGADWVVTRYDPQKRNGSGKKTWMAEQLMMDILSSGARLAIMESLPRCRGGCGSAAVAARITDFLSPAPARMETLFAYTAAREVVRLSDAEHETYVSLIRGVLSEIEAQFAAGIAVSADLMKWMYELVTESSVLLRAPLQRAQIISRIKQHNWAIPSDVPAGTFTAKIIAVTPFVHWEAPVTQVEFLAMARASLSQPTFMLPDSQRAIVLSILNRIGEVLEISAGTDVFELIAPQWRDMASLFRPEQHHFLDAMYWMMRLLAYSSDPSSFDHMITCVKIIRILGLEEIESASVGLRFQGFETRNPVHYSMKSHLILPAGPQESLDAKHLLDAHSRDGRDGGSRSTVLVFSMFEEAMRILSPRHPVESLSSTGTTTDST